MLRPDSPTGVGDTASGSTTDSERDRIGLPLHRTESGDDAEQGRRDGGREPPEASSCGARYNSLLVVVMHMSPRVESKSLTNNRETGHSSNP